MLLAGGSRSFQSAKVSESWWSAERPVLVIGATGMLGRPVADRLAADGFKVRVMSRDPGRARQLLGDRFDYSAGDVRDDASLARAIDGCGAAHINLRGTTPADAETVEAVGVAKVAAAALAARVDHVTYLSGAGIEAAPKELLPVRVKGAAEQALMNSGVPFTILRATHFMESLDLFVRGNSAVVLGRQPHRYHYLAAKDYAARVAAAYNAPEARNRALTLLGPEPFTMAEALAIYLSLVHPGKKLRQLPLAVPRLVSLLSRNRELQMVVALFDAFRRIPENDDGAEADRLLGKSTTTLSQWCVERAGHNL